MNEGGEGVFESPFGLAPVSYGEDDRVGVDALHLLQVQDGAVRRDDRAVYFGDVRRGSRGGLAALSIGELGRR